MFFRCVEDSFEAIMLTDPNGVLIYVNPAWLRTYEYSWEDVIGQTPRLLKSPYQDKTFYKSMWQQILDPKIGYWQGEVVNQSKSGKKITVLLSITSFKEDGRIQGYMGIALNISEKKNLEAKLIQRDRLATVGLLASGVAHEAGTPLGIIQGRVELIRNLAKDNDQIGENVGTILDQVSKISHLIRSLLNLSTGENQTGTFADIWSVIDEVERLVSSHLTKNKIAFIRAIPRNIHVTVGHNKLEQVLLNLLLNSVRAITLEIKNGRDKGHEIQISYCEDDNLQKIIVRDSGCGIEPKNLNSVFTPFFTTKELGEGMGLGLPLSYQIIREAGGDITIKSAVGIGSTVTIELPMRAG